MPLSLPVDMKVTVIIWLKLPLRNIILSVTYPDWLIRLNFRLHVSDNLPTDSHQTRGHPQVKIHFIKEKQNSDFRKCSMFYVPDVIAWFDEMQAIVTV